MGGGGATTRLQAACAAADVHPLLCAVAHRTGDLSLLREEFAPDQDQLLVPGRGLGPDEESAARALAGAALADHLAADRPRPHLDGATERRRIFGFLVGADAAEHWDGFLTEELALPGSDPREPSWRRGDVEGAFRCAVIGAGASGLAAAHRLRQAGVAVTVFEKNGDVGGTWLENVYPGCRVDVPNQLYSFSFAQTDDWVSRYSAQPDLLGYLQALAKDLGLAACIRFRSEVTEARFDESARTWTLTVRAFDGTRGDRGGRRDRLRGGAAQPAVLSVHRGPGALRRPLLPLGRLGRHGRAGGPARRGHRDRRQRGAVRPPSGGGGGPPRRVPAHPAVAAADGQLRRPVPARVP